MHTNTSVRRPPALLPLAASLASILTLAEPALGGTFDAQTIGQNLGSAAIAANSGGNLLSRFGNRPARSASVRSQATPAQVTSIAVQNCLDDGSPNTLRLAVLSANPGDTIKLTGLACSKITLQGGSIFVGLDDLTIEGPGAGALTIDGNGSDRVFLHGGKGTLTLTDLTVANGKVVGDKVFGGCIYSKGSIALTRAALTSCKAIGVTSAVGGGAVAYDDMTIESSTVSGNLADATTGQPKTAAFAGGVFAAGQGKGMSILHSIVSGNTVHAASGSALCGGAGGFVVNAKYSTVTGNTAKAIGDATNYGAGGGLLASYSLSMSNSTVDHNEADLAGGILVGDGGGFATILQSTISSNKGNLVGGGIESAVPLSLANSTVAFNTAGAYGSGGVFAISSLTLQSSILADNAPSDLGGGITATGANNIVKIVAPDTTAPLGTLAMDPMLKPLAFNGGVTRTHALGAASPAIDAGSNVVNLAQDQRDESYPRVVGALPDIGAVEFDSDHVFGNGFGEP